MIYFRFVILLISLLFVFSFGCYKKQGDNSTDNSTNGSSDFESDTCISTETGTSSLDGQTDSSVDTETETTVQGPITFKIKNHTDKLKYITWADFGKHYLSCDRQENEQWQQCFFNAPFCELKCDEVNPGDNCCIACEEMPLMRLIKPQETIESVWPGELFKENETYCSQCSCYDAEIPPKGHYRVKVQIWDEIYCYGECEGDEDGVFMNAYPEGDSNIYSSEFDIVFNGNEIVISIE